MYNIGQLDNNCKKNNLTVIKEFEVVESSTKGERPEFNLCLDFIRSQKEKVALVCDKVDRLQRSILDIPKLEELRINAKVVIHFLDIGKLDGDSNSQQKAFYRLSVVMANSANFINIALKVYIALKVFFYQIRAVNQVVNELFLS